MFYRTAYNETLLYVICWLLNDVTLNTAKPASMNAQCWQKNTIIYNLLWTPAGGGNNQRKKIYFSSVSRQVWVVSHYRIGEVWDKFQNWKLIEIYQKCLRNLSLQIIFAFNHMEMAFSYLYSQLLISVLSMVLAFMQISLRIYVAWNSYLS